MHITKTFKVLLENRLIKVYQMDIIPSTVDKAPTSNLLYVFDWTEWLGVTNITTCSVAIAPSGQLTTLATPSVATGNKMVNVWLGGGTAGVVYQVSCTINFDPGVTLTGGVPGKDVRTISVSVKDR